VLLALATAAVVAGVGASVAWPDPPERGVVEAAGARAHGRPILAEASLAGEVAVRGGRIWVGNPLDAFSRADQRVYLAWLDGEVLGDRALLQSDLILVRPHSPAAARIGVDSNARLVVSNRGAMLYALTR
jgi:hypothetical protein